VGPECNETQNRKDGEIMFWKKKKPWDGLDAEYEIVLKSGKTMRAAGNRFKFFGENHICIINRSGYVTFMSDEKDVLTIRLVKDYA